MRSPVKLAQAMLGASGADVRQDGVLDEQTAAAYEGATPTVREVVRESVRRWEGVDFDRIVTDYRGSRKKDTSTRGLVATAPRSTQTSVREPAIFVLARRKFISADDALALARKYDSLASLPGGTLELMLSHEAKRVPGGFDPSSIGGAGGKYYGLYQFHRDASLAWADGTRWARTFGVTIPPMHPNAWADPELNTACAAGYAAMNSSILRKSGLPVTKETLYASHQQGAGRVKEIAKAKAFYYAGDQSQKSVETLRTAFEQLVA